MQSTRRELLRSAAILGGAFAFTRVLAACAGPVVDDATAASADELVTCAAPVISSNHGHALVVSDADVAARADKTYDIKGTSSHPHSVTISAADFDRLAASGTITVVSTRDAGHTHNVTVTCASSAADAGTGTDGSTADASACTPSASSISANHGHAIAIPAADVALGEARTYSIKGASGHPHEIAVSAKDFAALRAGRSITITSTNVASHAHDVTIVCA